uniref:Uncharacterized protein n=1 Tax=Candidatus Kentrum sp. FW TaxID=2126338 RepID=A0A450SHB6_9GAMM|nr:MAG: hypothetical protein BECKFW1821A_GA0114235_10375 [Candidatus Kentron sp. FW]
MGSLLLSLVLDHGVRMPECENYPRIFLESRFFVGLFPVVHFARREKVLFRAARKTYQCVPVYVLFAIRSCLGARFDSSFRCPVSWLFVRKLRRLSVIFRHDMT